MARRKSEVYWEERSVEAKLAGIKDAEAYVKQLTEAYENAAKVMDEKLAAWYGRYAKAEGITIEQARAMIKGSDYAAFKRDVQEYINMGRTLPYSDEWAKELERLSAEYHVTRYEALIAQLRQRTEMIYAMQKGNLDDVLADIYSDQCHRMAFDLQNFTGLYGHFEAVSTDAAKLVLSHPWAEDGKIYSTRIWEHQKKLIGEVERILSRGLLTGDSYDNMAKQLEAAMKTGAFNANRLITTEAAYFQERARENTMDALGVEKRQVFATLDTKTCEKCGEKDLKLIGSKEVPVPPPFHVFCRCTHGPYYDDEFSRQFDKRAYRDPETGKTMTAEMMSYGEWKSRYVEGDEKDNRKKAGVNNTTLQIKEIDFYIGKNGKVLSAEYKEWIGDNKMQDYLDSVISESAKRYIISDFRRSSFIGDGSTVAMREFELSTGLNCGRNGRDHSIKVRDLIRQINKKLLTNLPKKDRLFLKEMLQRLQKVDR